MELTKIETEIVKNLSDGQNVPAIARYRFRSQDTIRGHIKNIHLKLNAKTNAQAVYIAVKTGIINTVLMLLLFTSLFPSIMDAKKTKTARINVRLIRNRELIG